VASARRSPHRALYECLRPPARVATTSLRRGLVGVALVAPAARGIGLGRRLLAALEQQAITSNPAVRLETNAALEEAIRLYRSSGYVEVPRFNDETYAHHWFEKRLTT
jgi:GNAT superfamily N-acetyltransferase